MEILPIKFEKKGIDKSLIQDTADDLYNDADIPAFRRNPLADMDFNIISETIRCQNLKKQMNIRLMNLKRSLNKNSKNTVK